MNSDPKIAAPNELPMVRKNVTPEVATPRSAKLDGVLHDQNEHLHAHADAGAEDEQIQRLQQHRCGGVHPRQQHKRDDHHRGPDDREDLVAAGAADDHAAAHRGQQQARHHRQRPQPRHRRRHPVDELHEGGQERQRAQHREPDDERQHAAHREHRAAEQPDRQDRFCRTAFHPYEDAQAPRRTRRTAR